MKRCMVTLILIGATLLYAYPVWAQNPFTAQPDPSHEMSAPPAKSRFFLKLILWQHQLKQEMAQHVREARATGKIRPIMFLMALAFGYGVIHAAGPGHGKFAAVSYTLSHRSSVIGGLLFANSIALCHGLAGILSVLGIRYIIQRGMSETLGTVTNVTQIISFSLITLLGLAILIKNAYSIFSGTAGNAANQDLDATRKESLIWAIAVGIIPCPAVVMVMLFCLSMDVLILGVLLAACIALGMTTTISSLVISVVLGKTGALRRLSIKAAETLERILGIVSGMAVAVFGMVFLLATIG